MTKKIKELVVTTGEYTNASGETKKRYENIGSVLKNENGSYIILKRTFNPAGVPGSDDRDSIIVSMFDPKPREEKPKPAPVPTDFDDDIPF